ncbi:hypothetical protein [Roseibacillus ishigakijimensis]|uniref:Uncharacterized protein n=1 Tax=Roseibacillus ishigakijimensis TaxID=454146 RepID=A0A934RNZ8_9BACT|nr:hypothetical protein [Roseibacillus ishigakijimensis]MBK1833157.1 hypothetical protein [Roseibacillus ishigakijimensis]
MKLPFFHLPGLVLLLSGALSLPLASSDHADPLVINPLKPAQDGEARLTDLYVFSDSSHPPGALVLILGVFPGLGPPQEALPLDFDNLEYRLALDLNRGGTLGLRHDKAMMQQRYGGHFDHPEQIAADIAFDFTFDEQGKIARFEVTGLSTGKALTEGDFVPGRINVASGLFDDPFLLPRFERHNVVAAIISLPLNTLDDAQEVIVWGEAWRKGRKVEHVGRAQRTQLPRFELLNTLPPSQHVREILRRHEQPTLEEDFRRTFLSPLFAHRPYDAAPDVVIFRLPTGPGQRARFPNGRALNDDVLLPLAIQGDGQLLEVAKTDDPHYDAARGNDKPFLAAFPYLAPPWTGPALSHHPARVPSPRPDLTPANWRKVAFPLLALLLALGLVTPKLWARSRLLPAQLGLLFLAGAPALTLLAGAASFAPSLKLALLLLTLVLTTLAAASFFFFIAWKGGEFHARQAANPSRGGQAFDYEDRQATPLSCEETWQKLSAEPYQELPLHQLSFRRLLWGTLTRHPLFDYLAAQRRILHSQAPFRATGQGYPKLINANGICLKGTWQIAENKDNPYQGLLAPGTNFPLLARLSSFTAETKNGHPRSLGLACQLFPRENEHDKVHTLLLHEDFGGLHAPSIIGSHLSNSPPATLRLSRQSLPLLLLTLITYPFQSRSPWTRPLHVLTSGAGEPRFLQVVLQGSPPTTDSQESDFREEILRRFANEKTLEPLSGEIWVSDQGARKGLSGQLSGTEWHRIGTILFHAAVASAAGDRQWHFSHHLPHSSNHPATDS